LRVALESETQLFKQELLRAGSGNISWNHHHFNVQYSYAKDEVFIGSVCLRLFIEAGESFVQNLSTPKVTFELLLRRALAEYHHDITICRQCFAAMVKIYRHHSKLLGKIEDCGLFVPLLSTSEDLPLQQHLLQFIRSIVEHPANAEQLLNEAAVSTLVEVACLCHTNPRQIAHDLARSAAGSSPLLLGWVPDAAKRSSSSGEGTEANAPSTFSVKAKGDTKSGGKEPAQTKELILRCWYVDPRPMITTQPPSTFVPAGQELGPFTVAELRELFQTGKVTADTLVSPTAEDGGEEVLVDKGIWKPLKQILALKNAVLLDQDRALLTPAGASVLALEILEALVRVHASLDRKGVVYFPLPWGKRLLSRGPYLARLATCLLANDYCVVDTAARLIREVLAHNQSAVEQIYKTGLFYFALAYEGANLMEIAFLLHSTHTKQKGGLVSPNSNHSILRTMLPDSLIRVLQTRGASAFAQLLQSSSADPELIWRTEMRHHLIRTIHQHLGAFSLHLRENTMIAYNFLPIPTVRYVWLEQELYCSGYYLSHLCDPHYQLWEICDPDKVLVAILEAWRELDRTEDGSQQKHVALALKVLGLEEGYTETDIKRAYRNLARKYHPDRNPQGREKFEEVQQSYEFLIEAEISVETSEMKHGTWLSLVLKSQELLYNRYTASLAKYKYPGYSMLSQLLDRYISDWKQRRALPEEMLLLKEAALLLVATCKAHPGNAEEFALHSALMGANTVLELAVADVSDTDLKIAHLEQILQLLVTALGSAASFECARTTLEPVGKKLASNIVVLLKQKVASVPCLELVARLSQSSVFQELLLASGVVWNALALVLRYDATVDCESSTGILENTDAGLNNTVACAAAGALSSIGGFITAWEELKSPPNQYVQDALTHLFTPSISQLFKNKDPKELLRALVTSCATPTRIWDAGMHDEVSSFIDEELKKRVIAVGVGGHREDDLSVVFTFQYTRLQNEITVGSVYLFCFNAKPDCTDIKDTGEFLLALLGHLRECPSKVEGAAHAACCKESLQAIHHLILLDRTCREALISGERHFIETLVGLLSERASGVDRVFFELCANEAFCLMLVDKGYLWGLIKVLFTKVKDLSKWEIFLALCSTTSVVVHIVDTGAMLVILGIITGHESLPSFTHEDRVKAAEVLKTILWNDHAGNRAYAVLSRVLPETLVQSLKDGTAQELVTVFDGETENPELVWNQEMRKDMFAVLHPTLGSLLSSEQESLPVFVAGPDFKVQFSFLKNDIYIGGIYLQRFLKEPTYSFKRPREVLEKIAFFWAKELESHISRTLNTGTDDAPARKDSSSALTVKGQDLLGNLTSSIIFLLSGTPGSYENLISWGWIPKIVGYLNESKQNLALYDVCCCCLRLLLELSQVEVCIVQIVSASTNLAGLLIGILRAFPPESCTVLELLKNLITPRTSSRSPLMSLLLKEGILVFLVSEILDDERFDSQVSDSTRAKVFAIEILKMFEDDDHYGTTAAETLGYNQKWKRYKNQSYSLFLTEKKNPCTLYLTGNASDTHALESGTSEDLNSVEKQNECLNNSTEILQPAPEDSIALPLDLDLADEMQISTVHLKYGSKIPSSFPIETLSISVTEDADGLGFEVENREDLLVVCLVKSSGDSKFSRLNPDIEAGDIIWAVDGVLIENCPAGLSLLQSTKHTVDILRRSKL